MFDPMIDLHDRRSNQRLRAQLEAARTAGAWMPWAGAALAILLWGGIGIWLVAALGLDALLKTPPLLLAGGAAAVITPGLALICAGIMAREGARSARANAVVLTSARLLLEPAETSRDEILTLAEAVQQQTQAMNRALVETRQRLDALKQDIDTSVTSALKAAEIVRADSEVLVHKMNSERHGMTQLAENLRSQSDALAKAIPRHAQLMAEATRAAQEQVRQADATLDQRLRDMHETSNHLAQRIAQLDTMGAESRKRAQNLASVLMRLDEQLVQSTRMVEAATKAGELAAAATKSTAESLRDTVSDALGSAMQATETINARSAQAAEDARQAMILLKEAGLQAEATTRAAAHAARAHAEDTERQINQLSDTLFKAATRATNAAESGLERARARIEKATALLGRMKEDAETTSIDDLILEPETPSEPVQKPAHPQTARPGPAERHAPPPSQPQPTPILRPVATAAPVVAPAPSVQTARPAPVEDELVLDKPVALSLRSASRMDTRTEARGDSRPDPRHDPLFDPAPAKAAPPAARDAPPPPRRDPIFDAPDSPITTWRSLLSGVEDLAPQVNGQQSAGAIIEKLDRGGVRLHVVKASDLRRIASAAHQGERQRRRAIRDTAPGEIQRVTRMLEADRELQNAARSFVAAEEPDALRVLSMADRAKEDAAPRLSAYLLLDAALGAQV